MQLNEHLNGAAPVPRLRPSPQPPHPQRNASNTDIDWLMTSWKPFLMILITTIILSLPILSKASTIPSETSLSCAAECIESSALDAGCAQSDVACRCRIGFGTDTLNQHEIFRCMDCCTRDTHHGYYKYSTTICGGIIPFVALSMDSPIADTSSDSLAARDEASPSCAVACIESSALVAGCAQNDIACRCRIVFGSEASIQDEIFGCMSRCKTFDMDGYFEYAMNICQEDDVTVDARNEDNTSTPKPDVVLAVEGTTAAATTTQGNRWRQQQLTTSTFFPDIPAETYIVPPRTPNQDDGLSLPAKIAIGVVVPVFVIVCIWAGMIQLKKRKKQKENKLTVNGGSDQDTESGGIIGGNKAELPSEVTLTKEEKKQEMEDKRATLARKFGDNGPQELENREESMHAQASAAEIGQGCGTVATFNPYQNQYSQMYTPPPNEVAELYSPGAYQSGAHAEMNGQSPRDLHEADSAPISQVASPAPTRTTSPPVSPQQNIARALGGTSPREERVTRALSSEDARPTPLAGPVPAALDLYPHTAESDNAAIVEEEQRLAAKRAAIMERKRLAEEEEQLEREEKALRRKKAAKGGQ